MHARTITHAVLAAAASALTGLVIADDRSAAPDVPKASDSAEQRLWFDLHDSASTADRPTTTAPREPTGFLGLDAAPLTEPIVTDRPDFTESTAVVPRGHLQLESGYTFTCDHEGDNRTKDHTWPEFLLRTGLTDDLELRVGWAGWSRTEAVFRAQNDAGRTVTQNEVDTGNPDMYFGFKAHLIDQKGLRPELSLIPAVTVPSGSTNKTSGDVDPEMKIAWSYELTEIFGLSGNVNLLVPTEDSDRFFQTATSVSLSVELTDRLGGYVEYIGVHPNTRATDCAHSIDGGLALLITNNLQFDIRCGFGLNEEADDLFAGAGFAIRY